MCISNNLPDNSAGLGIILYETTALRWKVIITETVPKVKGLNVTSYIKNYKVSYFHEFMAYKWSWTKTKTSS